jgi:hypothetical protein
VLFEVESLEDESQYCLAKSIYSAQRGGKALRLRRSIALHMCKRILYSAYTHHIPPCHSQYSVHTMA